MIRRGDVFFTHSSTLLGKAIRYVESDPGEPNGAWANHTGVFVGEGAVFDAPVVEALWHVRRGPLDLADGVALAVFRSKSLTHKQAGRLVHVAESYIGQRYGWWKLLGHLVDRAVFGGKKVISRLFFIKNRPICSFLVAHVFSAVGISFGMDPDAADPDEMMDYCLNHPEEWEYIGSWVS